MQRCPQLSPVPRARGRSLPAVGLALTAVLCIPASLVAQSSTTASISGTVQSIDRRPVSQALVALRRLGSSGRYEVRTTASGSYRLDLIQPGSYEFRVEALGFRPLVARTLTVAAGDSRSVPLTLTPEPPPVTRVDTLRLSGVASTRLRPGGVQLGGDEVGALPYRFDDLASVVSLSTQFDESLGALGLPGDMTLIVADGVPFYRAPHPTARQELLPDALFPRPALAGVQAVHGASDIELAGSASGYAAVSTSAATAGRDLDVEGAYAGKPTWSSSELDIEKPALLSWQGAARGMLPVTPSSRVYVSAEALRQETPLAPRVGESLASDLSALAPDLLSSLTDPAVESYDRYSGLLRYDGTTGGSTYLFARAAGSYARRSFTGSGPVSMAGASALGEESSDLSTAFGVVNQVNRTSTFEMRAGYSGSWRDFDGTPADVPSAYLTNRAARLGALPPSGAASTRTDFVAIPSFRWMPGGGQTTLKVGASMRISGHTMSRASGTDLVYSDAAQLLAGNGYGRWTSSARADFSTQEYGVFAQYESELAPGFRVRAGGRFDYESLRGDQPPQNGALLAATGLSTAAFESGSNQFGLRGGMTWSPTPGGPTTVFLGVSLQEGDLDTRAIASLYATGADGTAARWVGSGVTWPGGQRPGAAQPLPAPTVLGPDMRPPRTTLLEVGAQHRFGEVGTLFTRVTSRRTDFLTRRRNLNLPATPSAADPYGRGVYGTLTQSGATVVTTATNARRFPDFAAIWALDPDGWSEYLGVTAGFERVGTDVDVYASYTWSETTDNLLGAASGMIDATVPSSLPSAGDEDWSEGTSDFDAPHRVSLAVTARSGPVVLSAFYRFRSGLPFTPGYRVGVDANGDGSIRNDVAYVPASDVVGLTSEWSCLSDDADAFATRNGCRRPSVHTFNARVSFRLARFGDRSASLFVDGLDLLESSDGVLDDALLLIDPAGSITTSTDGSTVTLPTTVNPDFGSVLYPSTRGRMLRVGLKIGG